MNLTKNGKLGLGLVALAVLVVAIIFAMLSKDSDEGKVVTISTFEECVAAGYPVMESYPQQCKTPDGKNFTEEIGNAMEKSDLIRLESPRPNQTISSPLEIKGEARGNWYFEASFPAKLFDATGKQLAVIPIQAQGEWMTTDFVPFKATMSFPASTTETGTLVLEKDNASGLPENDDSLIIPIRFAQVAEGDVTVKAFFGNSSKGAECEKVVAVSRQIPKTAAIGRAAILELLEGPTAQETSAGYLSSINTGTALNTLTIVNGVARADFTEELDSGVAGSCRVSAIRSQIVETLKQFPTVKEVIISISGKSEDILQP